MDSMIGFVGRGKVGPMEDPSFSVTGVELTDSFATIGAEFGTRNVNQLTALGKLTGGVGDSATLMVEISHDGIAWVPTMYRSGSFTEEGVAMGIARFKFEPGPIQFFMGLHSHRCRIVGRGSGAIDLTVITGVA